MIATILILSFPAVWFDRLTILSLPKEERAGVRGKAFTGRSDPGFEIAASPSSSSILLAMTITS